jgi:hypothetical protein
MFKDLTKSLPVHPKKKPDTRKSSEIKKLVVHTTDWNITPEALAQYDIGPNHISSTGCPSITYAYLVERDGTVCKTAPETWVTWHVGNHNRSCLGISLVYKTDAKFESGKSKSVSADNVPSLEQMTSLTALLVTLALSLGIEPQNVVGHRELEGTGFIWVKEHKQLRKTCPGMAVNLDDLRLHVAKGMQTVLLEEGLYTGKIDGLWGPKSRAALEEYRKRAV